ncbi:hypothetical protein EUX98_g7151 [Antrodiella citrinella]|uniref:F-box domain-containing protein n=1 Tax=Antrodiella citrinella TaxID=2447956 RepID=A0A4S4MMI1_9APHY|nr:hypothetical protein EUX98_g7151 [Antrodiella citrinella]
MGASDNVSLLSTVHHSDVTHAMSTCPLSTHYSNFESANFETTASQMDDDIVLLDPPADVAAEGQNGHSETEDVNIYMRSWADVDLVALRYIFIEILPTPGFLDPALCAGRVSPWTKALRWKRDLPLVCKHWRDIALPFLYTDVVLRRVGQVFAFAETMMQDAPNAYYHTMVRSISFMCCVPDNTRTLYRRCVVDILERCPNVKSLTFGPTFPDSPIPTKVARDMVAYDYLLCENIRHILPRLTTFKIYDDIGFCRPLSSTLAYPPHLLSALSNIVSLAIPLSAEHPRDAPGKGVWITEYPPSELTLSRLEELTIRHDDIGNEFSTLATWRLPRLRRVNLVDPSFSHQEWESIRSRRRFNNVGLLAFFEAHAYSIKELSISCQYARGVQNTIVGVLTALRDRLTYVALPLSWNSAEVMFALLPVDEHNTDLRVDLWGHLLSSVNMKAVGRREVMNKYLLKGSRTLRTNVRILDPTLSHLPNILRTFCPNPSRRPDDPPLVHDFFGFRIVETSYAVFQLGSESNFLWTNVGTKTGESQGATAVEEIGTEETETEELLLHPLVGRVRFEEWSSGQNDFGDPGPEYVNLKRKMYTSPDSDASSGSSDTPDSSSDSEEEEEDSDEDDEYHTEDDTDEEEDEDPAATEVRNEVEDMEAECETRAEGVAIFRKTVKTAQEGAMGCVSYRRSR